MQDGAGHDDAFIEPRLHVGIIIVVLLRQVGRGARDAERMLQPAADVGMMIFSRGRKRHQRLSIAFPRISTVIRLSGLSVIFSLANSTNSSNISAESNRDLALHHQRLKPSFASPSSTGRIFLISSCGPKFVSRYVARNL